MVITHITMVQQTNAYKQYLYENMPTTLIPNLLFLVAGGAFNFEGFSRFQKCQTNMFSKKCRTWKKYELK